MGQRNTHALLNGQSLNEQSYREQVFDDYDVESGALHRNDYQNRRRDYINVCLLITMGIGFIIGIFAFFVWYYGINLKQQK